MFDACPDAGTETFKSSQPAPSAAAELNLSSRAMKEEYLNRALEIDLAVRWRQYGDQRARHRLITSHLRLASKLVHSMARRKDMVNDLMQEAGLGLMRAADKYDPYSGNRFATYATWWVRAAVQEAIMRDNGSVRLKSSSVNRTAFYTLPRIEARAEMILRNRGTEPTQAEIREEAARMMGMDPETLETIRATMPSSVSLNEPVSTFSEGESSSERVDMLVSPEPDGEGIAIRESASAFATNAIAGAMSKLNEREIQVVRKRTMAVDPMTLEDLSKEFDVSRERIRQIEVAALGKLKKALGKAGITNLDFLSAD